MKPSQPSPAGRAIAPVQSMRLQAIEQYSWLAIAAMFASTLVVPIVGKLSDLYGRKRFYVGGVIAFIVGSLIAGLAADIGGLIAGRFVQGLGIGAVMPLAQVIVAGLVSPRERGKYQGLIAGSWGVASVVGPIVGGLVTDTLGWRWLFLMNLPLGGLVRAFVVPFMRLRHVVRHPSIDYRGMFALTISAGALLFATVTGGTRFPWLSPQIVGCVIVCAVVLVIFVRTERSATEPVVPLDLWRDRSFTLANVAVVGTATVMFGAIFYKSPEKGGLSLVSG